jgi:predicted transcriptional regulator
MRVATGTVVSGKVVLDDPSLADGTKVLIVTRDREIAVRLSPEELAELEAGIAEADRGETISGEELFARLRRYE